MELLERAAGESLIALHARACQDAKLPSLRPNPKPTKLHGKRIVYVDETAPFPREITPQFVDALLAVARESEHPTIADIPAAGTRPRRGEPFCTIFAEGATERAVERGLAERLEHLHDLLRTAAHSAAVSASSRSAPRRRRAASSGS